VFYCWVGEILSKLEIRQEFFNSNTKLTLGKKQTIFTKTDKSAVLSNILLDYYKNGNKKAACLPFDQTRKKLAFWQLGHLPYMGPGAIFVAKPTRNPPCHGK
jgi:hypothetical protein